MRDPQNRVSALIRSLTVPTGMVFIGPDDIKIRAYKNSFQQRVKQKMPAEINPGVDNGSMIFRRASIRVQPSAMAHSSISFGIVRK